MNSLPRRLSAEPIDYPATQWMLFEMRGVQFPRIQLAHMNRDIAFARDEARRLALHPLGD